MENHNRVSITYYEWGTLLGLIYQVEVVVLTFVI